MGSVEARREKWHYVVRHRIILVADSSARHFIGETSGGSGRGLGMGSGRKCGRIGAASGHTGVDVEREQRPSKEEKGWAARTSEAVSITICLAALERTHMIRSLCYR